MEERCTGQFIAYDENHRPVDVFEFTEFHDDSSNIKLTGEFAGRKVLRTADGRVLTKAGDTYMILQTGQILHCAQQAAQR